MSQKQLGGEVYLNLEKRQRSPLPLNFNRIGFLNNEKIKGQQRSEDQINRAARPP
ncbi:hypothetical protein ACIFQM_10815 [Paenibacillus sp. NRS-1782]|uniref:hypothetical protein n=1 Tax=unclassified Paenibacillus TaxID=185978 RepID=UPI003D2A7D81